MSFTESIAAGRAFAQPGERRPDANQELLALGAANLAGGLFAAMPSGGGTSQTAVNARAGARTPVASLVTAAATAAVVLFLAPLIELMPQATLASVVIVTSLPLIAPGDFAAIRGVRTVEFRWAVAAMLGVIVLGHFRHSRGGDPVDGHAAASGQRSCRPRARPQAGHERFPSAARRPPGRPGRAGGAGAATRRADLLRECAARRGQDRGAGARVESSAW
jgi:hypothetical protein